MPNVGNEKIVLSVIETGSHNSLRRVVFEGGIIVRSIFAV